MNSLFLVLEKYSIGEGIIVSLFSMLIVFLILLLLSVIFALLKYIPFKDKEQNSKKPVAAGAHNQTQISPADDAEERMVAMLVASCLAKDEINGDIRVVSVERTK